MTEVNTLQQALLNEQLIIVAKGAQHCPDCLCASLLNEECMQEQEALEGEAIVIQALQHIVSQ